MDILTQLNYYPVKDFQYLAKFLGKRLIGFNKDPRELPDYEDNDSLFERLYGISRNFKIFLLQQGFHLEIPEEIDVYFDTWPCMPCHLLIIPKGNNIYNAAQYPNNEALKRSILSTVSFLSQRIKNCGLKGNIIVFENGSTSDNNLCRLPWEPDDICNNGIHLHIGFIPSNALTLDLDNRISFNGTSINQPFRKILTLLYKLVSPIPENIRIHSYTNDQSLFSTLPFGLEPYWNAMVFNSGEIQEVTIQNTGGRGKPSMLMRDIITRIIFDPEHELIRTEIYNYKKTAIRSITKLREYESIDPLLLISAEFIKLFFDILKYD